MVLLIGVVSACNDESPKSPESREPAPMFPGPVLWTVNLIVGDTVPRSLAGVRVELVSGPDAGRFTTTDAEGRASISGQISPSGDLSVRLSKDGFTTVERSFPLSAAQGETFVTLTATKLLNLAGSGLLTIEADPACDGLPSVARTRTYQADLAPVPPVYFSIRLGGATFFRGVPRGAPPPGKMEDFNLLGVFVGHDAARFEVYLAPWEEDPIVEQLTADTYVAYDGEATAEATPDARVLSGPFIGSIFYCAATPTTTTFVCPVSLITCLSRTHRLTLTRE